MNILKEFIKTIWRTITLFVLVVCTIWWIFQIGNLLGAYFQNGMIGVEGKIKHWLHSGPGLESRWNIYHFLLADFIILLITIGAYIANRHIVNKLYHDLKQYTLPHRNTEK